MNMCPLSNQIRETRHDMQNKSVTGSVHQDERVLLNRSSGCPFTTV